jgi:hypothetical protein
MFSSGKVGRNYEGRILFDETFGELGARCLGIMSLRFENIIFN